MNLGLMHIFWLLLFNINRPHVERDLRLVTSIKRVRSCKFGELAERLTKMTGSF